MALWRSGVRSPFAPYNFIGFKMKVVEIEKRMKEILEIIETLPAGTVSIKTSGNRTYYYNRYYDNGHRREKYIKAENAQEFVEKIKYKRELKEEYDNLKITLKSIIANK